MTTPAGAPDGTWAVHLCPVDGITTVMQTWLVPTTTADQLRTMLGKPKMQIMMGEAGVRQAAAVFDAEAVVLDGDDGSGE